MSEPPDASAARDCNGWSGFREAAILETNSDVSGLMVLAAWLATINLLILIFNLLRPDVFPVDDLGLQRAISLHYCSGRKASSTRLKKLGRLWSPWR